MADKNFIVKNGLEVGGQEVVSSSGVVTSAALGGQTLASTDSPTFNNLTLTNDIAVGGDLNLTGDLNITGDVNSLSVTDLDVTDQTITLGAGQVESASGGSGIVVDGSGASILWDETNDQFDINKGLNVTGEAEFANKLKVYSENNAVVAIDSLSNAYMVIDRSFHNRRGALVFSTAAADVFSAPPATGTINWALGVSDSDELSGNKFAIKAGDTNFSNPEFVIDTSGNVGIGTTSPNANLHIGSANATGDATNPAIQIGGTTTYRLGLYTSAEGAVIENKNGDDGIQFRVKTAGEAMRIDTSGNVGIGVTPSAWDGAMTALQIDTGSIYANSNGDTFIGANFYYDTTSNTNKYIESNPASAIGLSSGRVNFFVAGSGTAGNDVSFTEAMRIHSDGKVGIGSDVVSGPVMGLHVGNGVGVLFGPSNAASTYISPDHENTINGGYGYDNDTADLWVNYRGYQDGTTRYRSFRVGDGKENLMAIFEGSSGNVGIGLADGTSPAAKLEVVGSSNSTYLIAGGDDTSNARGLTFTSSASANFNGAIHTIRAPSSQGEIAFSTYNTERMRIDSSGYVGIGTDNPSRELHLYKASGNVFSKIQSGSSGVAGLMLQSSAGTSTIYTGVGSAQGFQFYANGSSEAMRIDSSGKVAIGSTTGTSGYSASHLLTLQRIDDDPIQIRAGTVGQGQPSVGTGISWTWSDASTNAETWASIRAIFPGNSDSMLTFSTKPTGSGGSNTERMRIDNAGNVTSPYTSGFQVTGTSAVVGQSSTGSQTILSDKFNTAGGGGGHNIGNDYNTSTGIYTAPVNGRYLFGYNLRWETGDFVMSSYIRTYISINNANDFQSGHQINGSNEAFTSFMAMSGSAIVNLSAGDTVRLKGGMNGGTGKFYARESNFYGILLS